MPYSSQQLQYLNAMGLVAWVQRSAAPELRQRFVHRTHLLNDSTEVVLVFESAADSATFGLTEGDEKLLRDMLQAIELDAKNIARVAISVDGAAANPDHRTLADVLLAHHRVALYVPENDFEVADDSAAASQLPAVNDSLPIWVLPHPRQLSTQPALKRRAWNVLKAVRAALNA